VLAGRQTFSVVCLTGHELSLVGKAQVLRRHPRRITRAGRHVKPLDLLVALHQRHFRDVQHSCEQRR
jgi:hypothetical protein